jgi:DNA adenine methylase
MTNIIAVDEGSPQAVAIAATPVFTQRKFDFLISENKQRTPKPFLKWAGGKSHLLPVIRRSLSSLPHPYHRYIEPFLGGGAVYFDILPRDAILGDSNPELMHCYEVIKEQPNELLRQLAQFRVSESEFYRIRGLSPEALSTVGRAARFIYLNKTCYNGLYRVNKKGIFNTPYGRHKNLTLAKPENIRAASRALQKADLHCADYQHVLDRARAGDLVYLDPPYLPVAKYSDFKRYTREFFYESDHEHLANLFRRLHENGCFILLSNSYHKKIAALYEGFSQLTVEVPRFVNCKGEGRGKVKELLISNFTLPSAA